MIFPTRDKAIAYIESQLKSYEIDAETFNSENPDGYWTNNDMCENELFLREEPIQGIPDANQVMLYDESGVFYTKAVWSFKTEQEAREVFDNIPTAEYE